MEKHNIRGFVSCPDASCLSFLFFFLHLLLLLDLSSFQMAGSHAALLPV